MDYRTRWHQIRAEVRQYKSGKQSLTETIRGVAIIGQAHERERIIEALECFKSEESLTAKQVRNMIYEIVDYSWTDKRL